MTDRVEKLKPNHINFNFLFDHPFLSLYESSLDQIVDYGLVNSSMIQDFEGLKQSRSF